MNRHLPDRSEVLVLFDGQCNLCSGVVQYLVPRDVHRRLKFASLQSRRGSHLTRSFGVPAEVDSVVVVSGGRALFHSDALITIGLALGGRYGVGARVLRVLPRQLRDAGYRVLARHRYRWFGQHSECWLPSPELRSRFAEDGIA